MTSRKHPAILFFLLGAFCHMKTVNAQESGIGSNPVLQSVKDKFNLFGKGKTISLSDVQLNTEYFNTGDSAKGIGSNAIGPMRYGIYASARLHVLHIPFQLRYQAIDGLGTLMSPTTSSFYTGNFDVDAYRQLLIQKVMEQVRPDQVMPIIKSRMDEIRARYERKLANELQEIGSRMLLEKSKGLVSVETLRNLSYSDPVALRNTVFSGLSLDRYREMLAKRDELLKMKPASSLDSIAAYREAEEYIRDYNGRTEVLELVMNARKALAADPSFSELASHFPFTKEKFRQYLKNPKNLNEIIARFGQLSGIQKVFTRLTHVNLGQNPLKGGDFEFKNVLNNGLDLGMMSSKMNAALKVGKKNHVNKWMRTGLNSIVENEYSGLLGMQIARGTQGLTQQTLSVNFFNFANGPVQAGRPDSYLTSFLPNARRQDAVVTYGIGFNLGSGHNLKVDVSKSLGTYRNMLDADSGLSQKSAAASLLGSSGFANYAAALDYKGQLLKTKVDLQVSKVGLGYNNPGNFMLNRGQTRVKWGLTRDLLKRKLQVRYLGEFRQQHFDPQKRFRYHSLLSRFQGAFRMRKGNRLSVGYQRSDFRTTMPDTKLDNGGLELWQATGSFRFRWKKIPIFYTTNLNWQSLSVPSSPGLFYKTRSLLLMNNFSASLGKNVLGLTLFANISNDRDYFFNTSTYSSELSYSYRVGKLFQINSSLGYFSNLGWNNQIGTRQQISGRLLRSWDISMGFDIKRAIRTVRSDMANLMFMHATLTYRR